MEDLSRRAFIINSSLAGAGLFFLNHIPAGNKSSGVLTCAASIADPLATIKTLRSGNWSDAGVWGSRLPQVNDIVLISSGHEITYDQKITTVKGLIVSEGALLKFDLRKSTTFQASGNILVKGLLQMISASKDIVQTLRFINVDETKFAGGGMNVIETDIGLWVMDSGQLDLQGFSKTSWINAKGNLLKGEKNINLKEPPYGWSQGDEICLTPTGQPAFENDLPAGFEERTIKKIFGSVIEFSKPISHFHPIVNHQWTAEVLNLTRNVRIEGTEMGKSHIFIRSSRPQTIKHVQFRYLGPRQDINKDTVAELVTGRYVLHFHHSMDGSRGSLVEGNVARDCDNHSYVPHVSHGIIFKNNIAFNITETAFWWDPGDPSHDIIWDSNIVALCKFIPRALDMTNEYDPGLHPPSLASSGFLLGVGDDNIAINNIVVGTYGDPHSGGAFNWEANNDGVWKFENNLAHHNSAGIRIWQVSGRNHVIENFTAYYNETGIFHGAYANRYRYNKGILYGNPFEVKAASINTNRVRIENMIIDGAGKIDNCIMITESPLPGEVPLFILNCTLKGAKGPAILNINTPGKDGEMIKGVDVICCNVEGQSFKIGKEAAPNEFIRVQTKAGKSFKISHAGISNIAPFAATLWGTGAGLKGEYFKNKDLTDPAFTRIDSNISFSEWRDGVHHTIKNNIYSIRWTGLIEPQFSDDYIFIISASGGCRLWMNNELIVDSWKNLNRNALSSRPVSLIAGEKYPVKLEFYNQNIKGDGVSLEWKCKSLPVEYIPQSQLYSIL